MNEIIKKVLNKGAPIDTPILIDLKEFFETFENEKLYEDYRKSVVAILSKIYRLL